jgi:hypothetical protein
LATRTVLLQLRQRNVIISPGVPLMNFGKDGDHIQISPPFIIGDAAVVEALDGAISGAVKELQS